GPLLYSIINKTVDSIDDNFASTSILKNTTYPEKAFSFLRLVYDYPMALLVFAFLVFLVILSVSIAMLSQKKRKIEMKHTLQLADALKRAETADASKSLFLSQMSHEIRTPLNSIIGFLELSKDATLEKVREYHINCDNAAKHLLSIVNDVLDMSAIEAGKMKIASAPFNLKDLISSISSTYIPICEKKNIDFNIKLSGEIDEIIVGDKMRFNQILLNILSNAVKFTEKGFIRLSISQTIVAEGNVYLTIKITDSGCGMSPELQSRLFSPFEQENAKTAQKFGGSGLGLSITKNLVSLMKGAIVAESNLGEGSTFTINLPFERSSEKFEYHSRNLNFKDLHVLVVDDDNDDCRYIASILSHMNINSHCVNGGFEALDEIERTIHTENEYNVCIIDVRMPDIDGIETSKMIRERYGKDVIVIVISAFQHYYNDTILIESGADTFIPKPLFQSSLYDLFVNLTDGHSVVAEKTQQGLTDFSGKRILLVEDNQLNRMIATGLLGKQGIVCDVAEDGQIGYEKFIDSAQGYYDAILMDIHMPNMNGYESTQAIRNSNHPDSSSIGIIAFTANAFQEEISKALAAGMNAHVPKPIDMPALDKALQQVFNKQ
ncbi:MAG: hybrid sensor histidine kinase/response regulator, partial [Anaerotignaceae bacterium]